jgi:hypothetical protein
MTAIIKYKIKDKNQELHIFQDSNPESPDDWEDDECFLVYKHREFQVDRKGFDCREIYDFINYPPKPTLEGSSGVKDYKNALEKWENNKGTDYSDYYVFPVDTYIHIVIDLSFAGKGNFPDRIWDVSTK